MRHRIALELLSERINGELGLGLQKVKVPVQSRIFGPQRVTFLADSFNCTM